MTRLALLTVLFLGACSQAEPPAAPAQPAPPRDTHPSSLETETWEPAKGVTGRDADRAPFSPRTPPDYVISYAATDGSRNERRTIRRHGAWARVESSDVQGGATHYVGFDRPLSITFARRPDGRYAYIHLSLAKPYGDDAPPVRRTGEQDVVIGERCTVWDVTARRLASYHDGARSLSCMTRDGIEMWTRYIGSSGYVSEMRALSLERRPVPAAEVTPPDDLLDPARWPIAWPAAAENAPDFLLTNGSAEPRYRKETRYRRVGDLERVDTLTSISWSDRRTHDWVRFERDAEGRYVSLSVQEGRNVRDTEPVPRDDQPLSFGGETCRWLHMTPGTQDYSRSACLTEDRSLLAERTTNWGSQSLMNPRTVRRARLTMSDIAPPGPVIEPANWGLPSPPAD